ncbi:MAG: DUF433 domain-containing protein [bacterium]
MTKYLLNRISINKNICHGKPHIRGTRIMVQQILDLLANGASPEEIIKFDFPDLTHEDIQACIAFASQLLKDEPIEFYDTKAVKA